MKRMNDSPFDRDVRKKIKNDSGYAQTCFEALSEKTLPLQIALLRRVYGISQEEVSSRLHVKQGQISRLEKKDSDHLLSTYQKVVKMLHSKTLVVPQNYKVVPA